MVRHQVLVLAFGGSNPSSPANIKRFSLFKIFVLAAETSAVYLPRGDLLPAAAIRRVRQIAINQSYKKCCNVRRG